MRQRRGAVQRNPHTIGTESWRFLHAKNLALTGEFELRSQLPGQERETIADLPEGRLAPARAAEWKKRPDEFSPA